MARSEPIADASLLDIRDRSSPGRRDGRDDADHRDDDEQFDEREAVQSLDVGRGIEVIMEIAHRSPSRNCSRAQSAWKCA